MKNEKDKEEILKVDLPEVRENKEKIKKEKEVANEIKEEIKNNEKVEENKQDEKNVAKEKVEKIIKKAKEKGNLTYGDLASELEDINQDHI